ncbi:phosphatidylinositol 3-kinase C2 domain-containing subunit gamma isoform X2 [Rissa tridactyla]|uniref:phosphatidylinositol 3-kinase C2 domain-containing subunit gamma isoform X2 n=1 Tax=Rissa tridactyla TaxID=75485 RepID=UPI0023BB05CC|nr:phosphatidylinositol 3-kinase C2 domain-containing subunit gamma isoform X2 [Rissa tridactyla]
MAYFGRVPFSYNEFCEGQAGDQASCPMYHSGSAGQVCLGFDRIVDEVSNEFFFYGSSHSHHHEEIFFPSDVFGLNVPDQQFCGQPLIAYGELHPGNPISHWQQGTVSPTVGFRSSLLSDDKNFSLVDPYPYRQERELYGGNSRSPVTNAFDSNVERGNTNLSFQIGFDNIDAQCPIFTDNYPFGQEARDESGNGEGCLTDASRRCEIGPTRPSSSGYGKESTGWSIQLVEANQGSNENTVAFCNAVEKIRNAYPAFDLKTNTGKIWSVAARFPDHILGESKFRISVWTDSSPYPLLLTQHAGCITHDLIVEILHCTNQYPVQEECLLSVCGSDEFLQNNHTLGSHESLRKATTCIQLRLHKTSNLKQSLSRTHEDDQRRFSVNQLLEDTCAWRLTQQNLVSVIMKYRGQVEYLLQNEHKVDNVIEVAKTICSVLCFVETKDITDAVKKLRAVPLVEAQNSLQSVDTPDKVLIEAAVTELSMAISRLIHVYSSSFDANFQLASIPKSPSCSDVNLDSQLSFTVYAAHNIPEAWVNSYKVFSFSCSLTYAGKTICQVKICKSIPAKRSFFFLADWNEKINFPLRIKALPRETMLTIKLLGVNSASKNTEVLGWTCSPLYPKERLIHGTVLLSMTLYSTLTTTMITPGICNTDTPTSVTLQIDFPETNLEFVKPEPEERRGDLEEPTKDCMMHITRLLQTHSLLLLSEQQRRILWFYRYYCNNQNCSLPLVLGSAPSWDRMTVSEMYAVLRRWRFSNPLEALGLLTFSFPDQDIRRTAVQQIENLSNDELLEYLPQLVQALKFEWSLESPLVKLLLNRSLQSIQVAHQLYWDRAPFIFTSEMEYFITEGGKNPQRFQEFVELCCRAYNIVRKHSQLLLNLLEMMLHAGLPELNSIRDLKYVYDNLRPQDSDLQATSYFTRKIKESLECFPVKLNNLIHTLVQMSMTGSAKPPAPETVPQEWMMLDAEKSIARATILGFNKKSDSLYLVQVVQTCNVVTFVEKSFDQFSKLHRHLQKQLPSHALPEFPHSWDLPFTDLEHKRVKDLNLYLKQLLSGCRKVANNELVLSFFLNWSKNTLAEDSSSVTLGPQSTDHKPGVQLVISYESTRLTIMLKHMRNIRLPDGSAPSAHAEFYLLPDPDEVSRRKTRTAPKSSDPTYNEIVVYNKVTELKGRVLKLVVKSKGAFVGAVNIQLSSVHLNEEKWYPLGNSII